MNPDVITSYPRRIVCLTEETTETLYLLGEQERIVGVSGYTVRPPEARLKPKVSAFITAKFEKIMELEPDLVLTFSDLQAEIAGELIKRGVTVMAFNQRSVVEILQMILTLGRLIGVETKASSLVEQLRQGLDDIKQSANRFPRRPRVFFEEWYDPLISGIRWVDELIELAGGVSIFPELRECKNARDRIVKPEDVVRRDPEVVIASWCGRMAQKKKIRERDEWGNIEAVKQERIYEIKSTYILQPGPASLTEGVRQLHAILGTAVGADLDPLLAPMEKVDRDLNLRARMRM